MYCKVNLVGRLGKDPETRGNGCKLRVATNENYKDKNGQRQEVTTWHDVLVWNSQATACLKHLRKGRQIFVEGSLRYSEYEGKQYAEIIAKDVRFLDNPGSKQ